MSVHRENLDFFNSLSATLKIQLSEPPERITPALENQKATPTAEIVSLSLEPSVYLRDAQDFRPLTEDELDRVVFDAAEIALASHGQSVTHPAPDGQRFTVRDLLAAVEQHERQTRAESDWFDGIDVHHIFFEGIEWSDGAWHIHWGS